MAGELAGKLPETAAKIRDRMRFLLAMKIVLSRINWSPPKAVPPDRPCRPMNCLLVMKIKWSLDINTGAAGPSTSSYELPSSNED